MTLAIVYHDPQAGDDLRPALVSLRYPLSDCRYRTDAAV